MRKEEITFYSQIIWKNLYDADRQILISNIFEKFYKKTRTEDNSFEDNPFANDLPPNVKTQTYTLKSASFEIGQSGYLVNDLIALTEGSAQKKIWELTCKLMDIYYQFTVGINNDRYLQLPEEEFYNQIDLVDKLKNILRKKINVNQTEDLKAWLPSIINFEKGFDENNLDFFFPDWDSAEQEVIRLFELFHQALGNYPLAYRDFEIIMKLNKDKDHFDWKVNPFIRDSFITFLSLNPFNVDFGGKIMNKEHKVANYIFANKTNLNQCLNTIKERGKVEFSFDEIREFHRKELARWQNISITDLPRVIKNLNSQR